MNKQEDVTVLWNRAVHTDREVTENRTYIIIKHKNMNTCIMTDVTITVDRNAEKKAGEKKLKYKSL